MSNPQAQSTVKFIDDEIFSDFRKVCTKRQRAIDAELVGLGADPSKCGIVQLGDMQNQNQVRICLWIEAYEKRTGLTVKIIHLEEWLWDAICRPFQDRYRHAVIWQTCAHSKQWGAILKKKYDVKR